MAKSRTFAAILGSAILAGLAFYLVRPPGPGQVYRHLSSQYGLSEHTALLLRSGHCLVLSQSEQDIGRTEAAAGSENRLFVIAAAKGIRSMNDAKGPALVDERAGLVARPGDAIDAEILFDRTVDPVAAALALGWPVDFDCGDGLATLFSISRVHR